MTDARALYVAAAARDLDAATRAPDAVARLAADGRLSAPMAAWALRTTLARYTLEALARFTPRDALAHRDVAVLLAESVPTAPLRAIVLPLLHGARRVFVRPPRGQRRFTELVTASLNAAWPGAPPVVLAPHADPRAFLADAARDGARALIAYGSDQTLQAIRGDLPAGLVLEGRGHGLGVSLVLREALDDPDAAAAVARDVAHYDQHGCLSPQVVLVEAPSAAPFARSLADALARVEAELPRGPLDAALATQVVQWQGALAAVAMAFHRGPRHAVAALATPTLAGTPGARNITVVPLPGLDHLADVLAPWAHALTCLGVAGPSPRWNAVALPPGAAPRRVPAGTMQDPPLDGYEDPRVPAVDGLGP